VQRTCGAMYPLCHSDTPWLELVVTPAVVAAVLGAIVVRQTLFRSTLLRLLSIAAIYGSVTHEDRAVFAIALISSRASAVTAAALLFRAVSTRAAK
jgi:hypothetical protein